MSNQSHTRNLKLLLAVNFALFFCAVTIASVAALVALQPSTKDANASDLASSQGSLEVQKMMDAKYTKLLEEAKAAIEAKDSALEQIRDELVSGYVVSKDIDITETDRAYWLSEPKLMLGVNALSGGRLLISFADQTELISVGERIDFKVDDCDCFLMLKSSSFGSASFRYSCAPGAREERQEPSSPIIDASLN